MKTHGGSLGSPDLPGVGDFVMLIITAVATPQRFYAQMPFGKNALIHQTFHGKEAGTYLYMCLYICTYIFTVLLCLILLKVQGIACFLYTVTSTEACYVITQIYV